MSGCKETIPSSTIHKRKSVKYSTLRDQMGGPCNDDEDDDDDDDESVIIESIA